MTIVIVGNYYRVPDGYYSTGEGKPFKTILVVEVYQGPFCKIRYEDGKMTIAPKYALLPLLPKINSIYAS